MIGLIGFIIIHLYAIKEKNLLSRIFGAIYTFIFIFYLIIYLSMAVGEINITVVSIIIFTIILLLGSVTIYFLILNKSKNIISITLGYLGLALSIILLFGFIFSILGMNADNQIKGPDNQSIKGVWNYVGFSASSFYAINFGEVPQGISRVFSYIEIAISFIIHIIILGGIINSPKKPTLLKNA